MTDPHSASSIERRTLLQGAAAGAAAASLPGVALAASQDQAGAAGDAELRIALVGCGGRGRGAINQALNAAGNAKLVALADAFDDRVQGAHDQALKSHPDKVDVPPERRYSGFDAFQKAIDQDIDVAILATPPGFRPEHFEYAVKKGCHVFMEKPVAVDGPGIRRVLRAAAESKAKNLKVGVGLQRHHSARYQEMMRRIHDGELGTPLFTRVYWNSAGVWTRERRPEWNEMTFQMRNWYYFNWICGDHIVEQHIHNLDVGNWVMDDVPASAQGMGGREVRTGNQHGEIYDHFAVEYTYGDGRKMFSQCRHQPRTKATVNEFAQGTLGSANFGGGRFEFLDGSAPWRYRGEDPDHYQVEHDVLFDAIRGGKEHNEAENGAHATLTAILGRMAAYTGKVVTWEQALKSERLLAPAEDSAGLTWDTAPRSLPGPDGSYPIPVPGEYELL